MMYMYKYKNQSNVHFSVRVILIFTMPIHATRPSMTMSYNDVSISRSPGFTYE